MKKFLLTLICVFSIIAVPVNAKGTELPEVTDHEKVTRYIFRGKGCGYCRNALTYFNKIASTYSDYFEVVTYEVYNSQYNSALYVDIAEEKGEQSGAVPFIVIGDKFSKMGFLEDWGEDFIEAALNEYKNEKYVDLVAQFAKDHPNAEATSLREACIEEGIVKETASHDNDTVIILGIFTVVVVGVTSLIFFSRKK